MIGFSEIRAQFWKWGCIAFAALAVVAVIVVLIFRADAIRAGAERAAAVQERDSARAEVVSLKGVLNTERRKAADLASIATQYEKDKINDQAAHARDIADLNSDKLQLRAHWQGCKATAELSGTAASAAIIDAAEQLRRADTATLIGIGREADTKERGLQAVIEADRKP